jgi:hypothetical protein
MGGEGNTIVEASRDQEHQNKASVLEITDESQTFGI